MTEELKRTPLHQQHVDLKAKIVPFAGWEMPVVYSSIQEEVKAVREKVGIFDVSHMGEFYVTGPDAVDFVDLLVTNDIKNAEVGKAVYSPLCREDGTVIDDLIVYKLEAEKLLVCVNAGNIDKDWQWFDSKKAQNPGLNCKLVNVSKQTCLFAIQGPDAVQALEDIELLPEGMSFDQLGYYSAQEIETNGEKIILARTGYTGEDGFEIFCSEDWANIYWDLLVNVGVTPCGLGARDVLRLEVCYPLYGHEITDEVTPLDSGLKWTVKMKKENFIGKDALSNYTPKYRIAKLSLEKGIPRQGYTVENSEGKEIGVVTSGSQSVVLGKGVALAHIKAEDFPSDEKFVINIRSKKYPATLHKKAFVSGGASK